MDITKIVDKYFRSLCLGCGDISEPLGSVPRTGVAHPLRGVSLARSMGRVRHGIVVFLAATAILGFLRSHLLSIAAFATGVLLLVDVWFDIMTASPHDRPTSIITGVCGNIPLALILMGIGI